MVKFEFFDHTADIGVRIYGENLENLFRNSALALFSLLVDCKPKETSEEKIILEAETLEELLVTWLNELLSLFWAYNFLPLTYSISIIEKQDSKILNAQIKGNNCGLSKNKIKTEVKAATYHDLKIKHSEKGYAAEIIFDV